MLVGLFGVAVIAILADLAGNDATRPFTRAVFGVLVLLESQALELVAGAVGWTLQAILALL